MEIDLEPSTSEIPLHASKAQVHQSLQLLPNELISSKIATPETTHFDFTNTHDSVRHHLGDDANVEESDEEEEDQDVVGEIKHLQPQFEQSLNEIYSQLQGGHVTRTKFDKKPASGEVLEKLPRKLKKSTSSK
ncbi:pathogen-associated molecular patterns-induced protein A70 [Senna tora]|uniref:Pathogen-associated molecular patterns-induced protein A70 n=1 Tax=Senna tora TaxID=362788 RepID=A0A834WQZ8_9FABA|nr:pathogen-associated molecular patterns-induced protein A70 [Senna tora]